MKKKKVDEYLEGFKDGLTEAYTFLYTKVGSTEQVRDTVERFREMQKKLIQEISAGS